MRKVENLFWVCWLALVSSIGVAFIGFYRIANRLERVTLEQAGRPLPTSKLPDGEYIVRDQIIFDHGRCYLAPKPKLEIIIHTVGSSKPYSTIWDKKRKKNIEFIPTPIDKLAIRLAQLNAIWSGQCLVIKRGERIYAYTFGRVWINQSGVLTFEW